PRCSTGMVGESKPRRESTVFIGILPSWREGWTWIGLGKNLEVFANADVESQVTPCADFVLGVKAGIGNRQRKNWVTHTLKVERIGAGGEIGEAEESVQTLRKPRRKIGSVRAVHIES